ncbi:MAG TPA: RES family NAD+ phosphorylase [Acetobacteraceae bacterium]|nr:RES family NAD+ phosphorylase [Acetobacteraceae bacterium]
MIPSHFPPIPAFDTVATTADVQAVMELEGWTNDRLVAERLARLPEAEWVYGSANSSVVMAAFLHASPSSRFSGPDLGAWYASVTVNTAIAEVGHHLRRETVARNLPEARRVYRAYTARLLGDDYLDIRGQQASRPDIYAPADYAASQVLGETVRVSGQSGIVYDSVRHVGGTNVVVHRPRHVTAVTQAAHYDLIVPVVGRIVVLSAKPAPAP